MKIFHQTGHRHCWNIESLLKDNVGDGIIFSPVNIPSKKLDSISTAVKKKSFLDPQLYLPSENKSEQKTYDFYPLKIMEEFKTSDFEEISSLIAQKCIDYQIKNDFLYLVVPTRYYDTLPKSYFSDTFEHYIHPFIKYIKSIKSKKKVLINYVVKKSQILSEEDRNELLNWLTGINDIDGINLLFENDYNSKMIKDPYYLFNALTFINALKLNDLEVHIGYNNVEGLLYTAAGPDSVSIGSYENLRKFSIKRLKDEEKKKQSAPNARLYSGKLLQWIRSDYIEMLKKANLQNMFEDSEYKPLMFKSDYNWHFTKPELYKHYFKIFASQVTNLPLNIDERISAIKNLITEADFNFTLIKNNGIILEENSDGSHLSAWLTSLNFFEKYLKENK